MRNAKPGKENDSFNVGTHGLRGVASVMVFAAHLLGGTIEHVYVSNTSYVATMLPFWNFGTFGVDLFFLISGFVILPSAIRYSPREFAVRRFWRLYPLFLALSLLFIVLNFIMNIEPKTNNWVAIVSGLTFINIWTRTLQLTPNAWSLTFEVWFYLMTVAGVLVFVRRPSTIGRLALLVCIALFISRYPITFWFISGIIVRLLFDKYEFLKKPHHILEFVALALSVYLASRGHYDYRWSDLANPVVPMLIVATTCFFAMAVSSQSLTSRLLNNRLTIYLGTVSYSLYLVHPYTYVFMRKTFEHFELFDQNIIKSNIFFFITTALVTLTVTHLVYRFLERAPYEMVFSERVYGTTGARSFFGRKHSASFHGSVGRGALDTTPPAISANGPL